MPARRLLLLGREDTPAAAPSSLLTSLQAYWKLDEASGTRSDAHGANHLTDNNTVTQAAGKLDSAAQFTASSSEYLSLADNAALSTGDIDFTLCAWVYLDSGGERAAVTKWTSAGNQKEYALLTEADSKPYLYVSHNGVNLASVNAAAALSTGAWHLLIGWHDAAADTLNLQVDNGSVNSAAHTLGVRDGTGQFNLGALEGAGYFMNGRIDGAGMWKRVLTSGERSALWNAGAGLDYPF